MDPAAIQMYNVLICACLISCHAAVVGSSMSLCGFCKWNNKGMSGETVHSSEYKKKDRLTFNGIC